MIVSEQEIRRVLALAELAGSPAGVGQTPATKSSGLNRPPDSSILAKAPPNEHRFLHVRSLKDRLASGDYGVSSDLIADKMIGRALCDQISRLEED